MRRLALLLALTIVPSLHAQSTPKPADIIAAENLFWKSYIAGDSAALAKQLAPDFISVEGEIQTGDQVLAFVKMFHEHCSLAPVKMLDPHVSFLAPAIATIVYHATETPTCGDKSISGDTNISTVWIYREGAWVMHLHTEAAVPPK